MVIDIILLNEHFSDKQSAEDDHLSQEISCQEAADTTLGKNPDDGLYLRYCSLSGLFVSGSRCLPYHKKLLVLKLSRKELTVKTRNVCNRY